MALRKGCNEIYFEWDFETWQVSQELWIKGLEQLQFVSNTECLEIGSRSGRLSVWLADYFNNNCKIICSDLFNPEIVAKELHESCGITDIISYSSQNILKLDYSDCTFDVVIFKSVVGALGGNDRIQLAINECLRVLKPGGILLFAENSRATYLHIVLRRKFNNWSYNYWYYPSLEEFKIYFSSFTSFEISGMGFFACFNRWPWLKKVLISLDKLIVKFLPLRSRYMMYGFAVK
jgi:ubiquinone/menaquinone biosynthesis C-methylase UbiE